MEEKQLDSMATYYDEWWENPKDIRGGVFLKLNQFVASRIGHDSGDKTGLDLGSGCGSIIDILLKKGYHVTGIEYGKQAAQRLKDRFPGVEIVQADLNKWRPGDLKYDLVTMIELTQNFSPEELRLLLLKVRSITKKVVITCPNFNSLQGRWVTWRKFKAPFVYLYKPDQFEKIVESCNFKITYSGGIGFLMPITLFGGFRCVLIPKAIVKKVNSFMDKLFPKLCSLYYLELE